MIMSSQTHIAFCIDESGSVRGIIAPLVEAYNNNVVGIRQAVLDEGQEASMTALAFGDSVFKHRILYTGQQVQTVPHLKVSDLNPSGMTPLFDSVYRAIKKLEELDDGKPDTTFVVNVVTDGRENNSYKPGVDAAIRLMNQKIGTDRWTFTFLVPHRDKDYFCKTYDIQPGNVQGWDEKTAKGTHVAFKANTQGFKSYFGMKSRGVMSTNSFYSDISDLTVRETRSALSEITKQVTIITVSENCTIREAVNDYGLEYIKGAAFYQLVKTEKKVQPSKMVVLKVISSGKFYAGKEARSMLGIDVDHTVRLVPKDHGKFEVYIQSTSYTRKIPAGTNVLYWPKVGTQKK